MISSRTVKHNTLLFLNQKIRFTFIFVNVLSLLISLSGAARTLGAPPHGRINPTLGKLPPSVSLKSVSALTPAIPSALPNQWVSKDIGSVSFAGGFSSTNDTFTINGSGADIWNASDAFHYVYQPLSGDAEIVARVTSVGYTDVWAKAGVMIRESLAPDSAHAMMVVTPGNGVASQYRPTTGWGSGHTSAGGTTAPAWVKLVRSGNSFSGFTSNDGVNWLLVRTETINMASTVYVGLAVTSHNDSMLCTATLDSVSLKLAGSWQNQDIGSVNHAGRASQSDGTFTVNGSGADIWDTSDAFHYVYQPLTGDGQIVARVASIQNTDVWAKAGVMIRESLAPDSAHAMMVVTPGNGVASQYRPTTGWGSGHTSAGGTTAPAWVKLVRSENNFNGYKSSDGMNWVLIGTLVINMASNVHIGLAVTSHNNSVLNSSTFDNVSVTSSSNPTPTPTPTPTPPPAPIPINNSPLVSITGPSDNETFTAPANITITANASDSDGTISKVDFYAGSTLVGTDTTVPYSAAWNGVAEGTYTLTAKVTDNSQSTTASAPVTVTTKISAPANKLTKYIDPAHQTSVPFNTRSHWAQPWRAYLETVSADTFLKGAGVNYQSDGNPDLVMRHLANNGFSRIRLEIGWGSLNYTDETKLDNADRVRAILLACKKYGIRPLILLNGHHGVPTPTKFFDRSVTVAAPAGSRTVTLNDVSELRIGHSGLSNLTDYWAAEALITAINGNTVTLSKPLPNAIAAGAGVAMATLKYRPFSVPGSADYNATIAGWQRYMATVQSLVTSTLGTQGGTDAGFDLEVWNELIFGSHFLNINDYYEPDAYTYSNSYWGTGNTSDGSSIWKNLVQVTADYALANPTMFRGVQIGDGFANTLPFPAASTTPSGITAISKHPYSGRQTFPAAQPGGSPLNALFQPDTSSWQPSYTEFFPEYLATAIQTEHMIRDMSPITTDIYGTRHGRNARTPSVSAWITELGIAPREDDANIDATTAKYIKGKTTGRYFSFYLNKGVTLMTLFNDSNGDKDFGLVSDDFLALARTPGAAYPADDSALTSPALKLTGNIARKMRDGLSSAPLRQITLDQISDTHNHVQFAGDPATANQIPNPHPPLYNRDVFAFLPFQVNAGKFVIPYYVMTRDIRKVYDSSKTGGRQYDMPTEEYQLTISGIRGSSASIEVYDPLNNRTIPVTKVGGTETTLTVTVKSVDYPYLLIVQEN